MTGAFNIHSLRIGELYLPHNGAIMRDPVHCWLVNDGRTRILVDSGMPPIDEVTRTLNVQGKGGGHDSLRAVLESNGLTPDDIQYVVLTHLHFDHGANLDLFPKACIILQREEIFHAVDPVPTQRIYYRRDTLINLINRKRPVALQLVQGDVELVPGFEILHVPSHTPGMQIPIVTTARGRAALVSDLGDHYWNWFPADPRATNEPKRFLAGSFLPSPIRTSGEREYLAAMQRIVDHSDIVIPAHDFRIPRHMPQEWFEIPESTAGDLSHLPPEPA